MRLSVVIPARDEEENLPGLFAALAAQTRLPDEVVVVDSASRDRTAQLAASLGARVLRCDLPGVALARQTGLEAARGEWVVSTDADSRPGPGWLAALEEAITPGTVGLYGPLELLPLPGRVPPRLARASRHGYRAFLGLMAAMGRPNCAGANMACSRAAALLAGGYPQVEAGEDVRLGQALARLGKVGYVPGALVLTSARRLERGWRPFLWQHLKNLAGRPSGYVDR